jgi:hypothetical protein
MHITRLVADVYERLRPTSAGQGFLTRKRHEWSAHQGQIGHAQQADRKEVQIVPPCDEIGVQPVFDLTELPDGAIGSEKAWPLGHG